MPFTFAHPLYAAPLKVIKPSIISLTGIVLGSMSPDFEYFIALEPHQTIGHSTLGLLLQAIPLSLLFAFIFHYLLKSAIADNLPAIWSISGRAQGLIRTHTWRMNRLSDWIVFVISVAIGFYSHVLLDGFTHVTGYFVQRNSFLQYEIMGYPVFKFLQHGLSLIGLSLQGIFIFVLFKKVKPIYQANGPSAMNKWLFWIIVSVVAVIVVALKFLLSNSTNYIGMGVVSMLSGTVLGIIVASLIYRLRNQSIVGSTRNS
ncbi:DUF4184 family protein [Paenibacillus sp. GSMTC-2017]|uniref:DUF4184 family protein n=1 Tax=Paenibacillus sp. GSMTC-2017 TaxID=2794350 RepID=UPI0018D9EEA7|nr:DUF4184 family protein [Paenibacillus sp. GSMTC-2017]MBH5319060.1 DUF4184 family protein [Paenibacillus sp. GSMTC-2017]